MNKQFFKQESETKIALLDQSITYVGDALKRIEARFEHIDRRFDILDSRIEHLDHKFDAKIDNLDAKIQGLGNQIDSKFNWFLGIMLGGFAGLFGLIAHGFKWIP